MNEENKITKKIDPKEIQRLKIDENTEIIVSVDVPDPSKIAENVISINDKPISDFYTPKSNIKKIKRKSRGHKK